MKKVRKSRERPPPPPPPLPPKPIVLPVIVKESQPPPPPPPPKKHEVMRIEIFFFPVASLVLYDKYSTNLNLYLFTHLITHRKLCNTTIIKFSDIKLKLQTT